MLNLMSICMQKLARAIPLAVVALGVLAGSGVVTPATTYGGMITIDAWIGKGQDGVVVGDKRFTFVSQSNLLGSQLMVFDQFPETDTYKATLKFPWSSPISTWGLKFNVDIVNPFLFRFAAVGIDTIGGSLSPNEVMTTTFTPDVGLPFNLQSTNGNPATKAVDGISLMVDSSYTNGGPGGIIDAATWDFQPTAVPEPGTLTLLGVGFGFATYRRRKQAK